MQFRKIPCCLGSRQTDYTPPCSFFIVLRLPCQPFVIAGFGVRSWLHLGSVLYCVLESGKKTRLNCVVLVCVVPAVLPCSVSYQLCGIMLVCVVPVTPFLLLCWSAMPGFTTHLGRMNRHSPLCYMLTVRHHT